MKTLLFFVFLVLATDSPSATLVDNSGGVLVERREYIPRGMEKDDKRSYSCADASRWKVKHLGMIIANWEKSNRGKKRVPETPVTFGLNHNTLKCHIFKFHTLEALPNTIRRYSPDFDVFIASYHATNNIKNSGDMRYSVVVLFAAEKNMETYLIKPLCILPHYRGGKPVNQAPVRCPEWRGSDSIRSEEEYSELNRQLFTSTKQIKIPNTIDPRLKLYRRLNPHRRVPAPRPHPRRQTPEQRRYFRMTPAQRTQELMRTAPPNYRQDDRRNPHYVRPPAIPPAAAARLLLR